MFMRKYQSRDKALNTPFYGHSADIWNPRTAHGVGTYSFICTKDWKKPGIPVNFWVFHDFAMRHNITVIVALLSRLAEICVRTIFLVVALTAAMIFSELDDNIKELQILREKAEKNPQKQDVLMPISDKLEEWWHQYVLACEFVENLNLCFGFVLMVAITMDSLEAILEFQSIFIRGGTFLRYYVFFIHILCRYGILLVVSHRVEQV